MNEKIKQIAQRIEELRKISDISQEKLAEDVGLNLNDYKSIENGDVDISLALLIKLSNKFKVELTSLLTGSDPKLHQYCVVRKGHGVSVERRKQYKYESLAYNFAHKHVEPFIVTVEPDSNDLQFNSHPGQEFNYVLEGSLKLFLEDHEITLNEGDSIYFNSSYKHSMKAMNNAPAKILAITI